MTHLPRLLLLAAVPLLLAGCGGASGASPSSPSLSAGDRSACDALNSAGDPPDVEKLYASFGPDGSESSVSTELKPHAMLVGSEAQLAVTGAGDDAKLHEYIGQMRGVCETLGWLAR